MKKLIWILIPLVLFSCDPKDLQKLLEAPLTNADIANGLKEALNIGVGSSVDYLSAVDGYYQSPYKILLPEEARTVTDKLKFIPGFTDLEDEVIKRINRSAEDAAKKAAPIFIDAITSLTFDDVMNILMGEKNAATSYLHGATYNALYNEFNPVVVGSLNKYNALDYWADAVNKYNSIPFVTKVNPDLADHVTNEALKGLFSLIEVKEEGIRTDISQRTSDLLRRVFKKQDNS
jgi:translation elongation factor EF-G